MPPSWRPRLRLALVVVAAVAVAVLAFVYRFNTPEGSIGGFTNDQFAHLMRAEMMLRGQQPLRDFADAELRGAWPALSYAVPAWAQQIGGRTLLSGGVPDARRSCHRACAGLSLRARLVETLVGGAAGDGRGDRDRTEGVQLSEGADAGAGRRGLRFAMSTPFAARVGPGGVGDAVATLFRHDCGVYVAVGYHRRCHSARPRSARG